MNLTYSKPRDLSRKVSSYARAHLLHSLCVFLSLIVSLHINTYAQAIENYMSRKEQEKQMPNRFLTGESTAELDQLGRYYRRAFSQQQGLRSYRFGPTAATDQTAHISTSRLPTAAVFEGPIDPERYRLGPMDLLAINVWSDIPATHSTLITPEGSIIIPTVGEVSVRDRTLAEAKKIVAQEVAKKYSKATTTLTLLSPRTFQVHVAGTVQIPGSYEMSSLDRADKAVYLANFGPAATAEERTQRMSDDPNRIVSFAQPPDPPEPQVSLRNIILLRGRDSIIVDLLRYYATGNAQFNPTLLDGDVLVVPPENMLANRVSVYGGVRLPGSFEFHAGDSLGLLIRIAQGFTETADLDSIRIVRFQPNGISMETMYVDGHRLLSGAYDMPLQRNDRVFVRQKKQIRREHTVSIKGEVQFAGSYPISEESTRLSEVIAWSGGFTANAAVTEGLVLRSNPNLEIDPLQQIPDYDRLKEMRLSGLNREEREYYTYEAAIKRNFVSVDFRRLFLDRDPSADVTLRDGDEIIIPSSGKTVYVYGQVIHPGHITFVPGMEAGYYIRKAGGISQSAVLGDAKVIKAGSKNWVDLSGTPVEPGDVIYVPRELERDFVFYFTAIRDFLQVATSAVTIYLLIQQIRSK